MPDKVKPLKIEDATSGTEADMMPTQTDPLEDYLACKGIAFENSDSYLIDISSGDIQFTDTVNGTILLSSLIDQIPTYTTVTSAESATGSDNDLCYVVETNTFYRYEADGSAYTDDNKYILSTGDAGTTRWLAIGGNYNIKYANSDLNTADGYGALDSTTSGSGQYNTAYGRDTATAITTGDYNVAMGYRALYTNTGANSNVAIGTFALRLTTGSANNLGIGTSAGYSQTSPATPNTFIGSASGYSNVTGEALTYIGNSSGYFATSSYNTVVGYQAYYGVSGQTTGNNNTAIGYQSLYSATTASNTVTMGIYAGYSITSGNNNIAIGNSALVSNQTTDSNVALGSNAGYSHTTGSGALYIGRNAGYSTTTAGSSIFIGINSGRFNVSGVGVIYIGYQAGYNATSSYNTILGSGAYEGISTQTTGNYNTAIGYQSLFSATSGYNNSTLGSLSGYSITTGYHNTFIGKDSGYSASTSLFQTFVGKGSGYYATGSYNAVLGTNAYYGVSGQTNGNYNIAIGHLSLFAATSCSNNIAIGYNSGSSLTSGGNNTLAGYQSGDTLTTGSSTTVIGYDADVFSSDDTDSVIIGASVTGTADQQIRIGNSNVTSCYIEGIYGQTDASNPFVRIDSNGRLYQDSVGGEGLKIYTTVALAEAASGSDNDLMYCVETETIYRYEATGSAYTDDNTFVLSTGDAGNTRWLGVGGKYKSTANNVFEDIFTASASQTQFTLSATPQSEAAIILVIDGIVQGNDTFTYSGTTLTLDTALDGGEKVVVKYNNQIDVSTPQGIAYEDIFTATASQTDFTLSYTPISENSLIVAVDAALQGGDQYSLSGTTLTFGTGLTVGQKVVVKYNYSMSGNAGILPYNYIAGLGISQDTDTDHDILIDVGKCRDNTDSYDMYLSTAITKQIDATWAVGDDAGGLDTGTVANDTWYYIWLIRKDSDGSIDALFSTSKTSPTMPAGYTYKRRIRGAVLTDGSANILGFFNKDNYFYFKVPIQDISLSNPGTSAVLNTVSTPPDMIGIFNIMQDNGIDGNIVWGLYTSPSATDTAPSSSYHHIKSQYSGASWETIQKNILCNSSSQIRSRVNYSTAGIIITITTNGFIDNAQD